MVEPVNQLSRHFQICAHFETDNPRFSQQVDYLRNSRWTLYNMKQILI